MYLCLCFGVTEQQVQAQIEAGACSPRQIASVFRAGTDCGGCVKRIQAMLGRPAGCPRRRAAAVGSVAKAADGLAAVGAVCGGEGAGPVEAGLTAV